LDQVNQFILVYCEVVCELALRSAYQLNLACNNAEFTQHKLQIYFGVITNCNSITL